ncbi:hypothetical protein DFAR_2460005 [Desulfarculales bacterium]
MDFITSPWLGASPRLARRARAHLRGPAALIPSLGVFRFPDGRAS